MNIADNAIESALRFSFCEGLGQQATEMQRFETKSVERSRLKGVISMTNNV